VKYLCLCFDTDSRKFRLEGKTVTYALFFCLEEIYNIRNNLQKYAMIMIKFNIF